MIQLAIHAHSLPRPQAVAWRAIARSKSPAAEPGRLKRSGHAWPFLSRQPEHPVVRDTPASRAPSTSGVRSGFAS